MFGQWFGSYFGEWSGDGDDELPPIPPVDPPIYGSGGSDYSLLLRNARLEQRRRILAEDEIILAIIVAWLQVRRIG